MLRTDVPFANGGVVEKGEGNGDRAMASDVCDLPARFWLFCRNRKYRSLNASVHSQLA